MRQSIVYARCRQSVATSKLQAFAFLRPTKKSANEQLPGRQDVTVSNFSQGAKKWGTPRPYLENFEAKLLKRGRFYLFCFSGGEKNKKFLIWERKKQKTFSSAAVSFCFFLSSGAKFFTFVLFRGKNFSIFGEALMCPRWYHRGHINASPKFGKFFAAVEKKYKSFRR